MMLGRSPIRLLVDAIGLEATAFALNLDEPSITQAVDKDEEIPSDRATVLGDLGDDVQAVRIRAVLQGNPVELALATGLAWGQATHPLVVARLRCGGAVDFLQTGDTVVDELSRLAVKLYPTVLIDRFLSARNRRASASVTSVALMVEGESLRSAQAAILQDPALSTAWPDHSQGGESVSHAVSSSLGSGVSGLDLSFFPAQLIAQADVLACLTDDRTLKGLLASLDSIVEMLRGGLRAQRVTTPFWLGINGVALDEPVELPWGRLVPYSAKFDDVVASEARPSVLDEGRRCGAVLEGNLPYSVHITSSDEWAERPDLDTQGQEELGARGRRVCQAVLLGSHEDSTAEPVVSWWVVLDPINPMPSSGWRGGWHARSVPSPMRRDEAVDVQAWASAINVADDDAIGLAWTRLLTALSERVRPADALVDIVIAWENLFGDESRDALAFRISAAVARLLAASTEDRRAIQRSVKRIYSLRSKLVHGQRDLAADEATAARAEALKYTIASLRVLYKRPDLIAATDRANTIILNPEALD